MSLYTPTQPRYGNLQTFSITTSGMPVNTVQIALTISVTEGKETRSYTLTRKVYLRNNNPLGGVSLP